MQLKRFFLQILLIGCFLQLSPAMLQAQTALSWASYYGATDNDYGRAVATDAQGNVSFAGYTQSTSAIASAGAHQTVYAGGNLGAGDACLAKFNSAGTRLWGTYYGGSDDEQGLAVATDKSGNVYLAGYSKSLTGISTAGSFQTANGGADDAFLVKFSPAGVRLWATYYGGTGSDKAFALAADTAGNIYMAGSTRSAGLSTAGAHQSTIANTTADEGFLVKFDSLGNRLWATYYGGAGGDIIRSLAIDKGNNIVVGGQTTATSVTGIASAAAFQTAYAGGSGDGVLARFNSGGQRIWGSYYGASGTDQIRSISCDDSGHIYLAAVTTSSAGLATSGSFQTVYGGGSQDGLVAKFDSSGNRLWATYYGGSLLDDAAAVTAAGNGFLYVTGVTQSVQNIATPGIINDTLQVRDAYLAKFGAGGARVWGTYTGGSDIDVPNHICYNGGNIYIAGQSNSAANLSTAGSHQAAYGGAGAYDGYLMKVQDCPVPVAPATIGGPTFVCPGSAVSYWVSPPAGAMSYTWTLPAGWSGSSNMDTIYATTGGAGTDTIRISANYLCGSSAQQLLAVTVSSPAMVTALGATGFCAGDSVVLKANTQNGTAWQWMVNGGLISNANDSLLTVYSGGVYTVATLTNGICADTSGGDTVTVHVLPLPTISFNGAALSTGSYVSYQWIYNGSMITGANQQSYVLPTLTGSYQVYVTDTNGCGDTSAAYLPLATGVVGGLPEVSVWPNPVGDVLHVAGGKDFLIKLYDLQGRVVAEAYGRELQTGNVAAGVYAVKVSDAYGRVLLVQRVVKE